MQNHQFDLSAGESIFFGEFKVTLLEIEGDDAVFEIEGPDGDVVVESVAGYSDEPTVEDEQPVLV